MPQFLQLRDGDPEAAQCGRELWIFRRAGPAMTADAAGTPSFEQPASDAASAGDRDTQAQGGQFAPVSCCVGPQVGRGEGGPVLVQDTQPAAGRADGTASVSFASRIRASAYHARLRSRAGPRLRPWLTCPRSRAPSLRLPRPRAGACHQPPRAATAQPVVIRASAACSNCRAVTCGGPSSLRRDESSTNRASAVQCGRCWRATALDRAPCLAHRVGTVAVERGGPGEYQPCLREHDLLTLALDLPDGLLTGLPRL